MISRIWPKVWAAHPEKTDYTVQGVKTKQTEICFRSIKKQHQRLIKTGTGLIEKILVDLSENS